MIDLFCPLDPGAVLQGFLQYKWETSNIYLISLELLLGFLGFCLLGFQCAALLLLNFKLYSIYFQYKHLKQICNAMLTTV